MVSQYYGYVPTDIDTAQTFIDSRRGNKAFRTFTHAAAENQQALFASEGKSGQSSPGAADSLGLSPNEVSRNSSPIKGNPNELGFLEVYPRVGSRSPKLLLELEGILVERLRSADKTAGLSLHVQHTRDPNLGANLHLDSYRAVFASFIAGFATYGPLLSEIKFEFERALDEGVRCAQANVLLRAELARQAEQLRVQVDNVRAAGSAAALPHRQAMLGRLADMNRQEAVMRRRAAATEKELAIAKTERQRLEELVERLEATNRDLTALMEEEQRWTEKSAASDISRIILGPLTHSEEVYLENEIGTSTSSQMSHTTAATSAATSTATPVRPAPLTAPPPSARIPQSPASASLPSFKDTSGAPPASAPHSPATSAFDRTPSFPTNARPVASPAGGIEGGVLGPGGEGMGRKGQGGMDAGEGEGEQEADQKGGECEGTS